jgi:MFS family permease
MPVMLKNYGMGLTGFAAYGWIALLVSTFSSPLMGRLADRFGYRNILIIAWLGVFWQPLLFIYTPDDMPHTMGLMPYTIIIDAIAGGIFWTAFTLAQVNIVIGQVPSESRSGFFATLSAIAGSIGFIAAIIGGTIATSVGEGNIVHVFGLALDNYRTPMLIGVFCRFFAGLTIFRIEDPAKHKGHVTSAQAFVTIWRMLIGKQVR